MENSIRDVVVDAIRGALKKQRRGVSIFNSTSATDVNELAKEVADEVFDALMVEEHEQDLPFENYSLLVCGREIK